MERFPREAGRRPPRDAPLADRMRPRTLEDFEGQEHLLGASKPLAPLMAGSGSLPSSIFWGPPGSGKTTLARLLAERAGLRFVSRSAVLSGVKELRSAVADAESELRRDVRTALFIDEIHRFNKSQLAALLPYVEPGTITVLGGPAENASTIALEDGHVPASHHQRRAPRHGGMVVTRPERGHAGMLQPERAAPRIDVFAFDVP